MNSKIITFHPLDLEPFTQQHIFKMFLKIFDINLMNCVSPKIQYFDIDKRDS